jgi:putative sigma-54 modulation protein
MNISEKSEAYITKKTDKFNRFLQKIDEIRVDLSRESTKSRQDRIVVEITVRSDRKILRAEERSHDLHVAVDVAVDKLNRQIARLKGKRIDRWHANQSIRHESVQNEEIPPLTDEDLDALADESGRSIVRVKQFSITPMNAEEAIEQMQLLAHDFFVFFNADVGRLNVLYKREDDNYGLIDPVVA